jgi:hypothetical protein
MDIVLDFYRNLPFNIKQRLWLPSSKQSFDNYSPKMYQHVLRSDAIIDIGCGPGHLINSLNYHFQSDNFENQSKIFHGIDFNPTAINYAENIVLANALDTKFYVKDVFHLESKDFYFKDARELFIISIGALHHTNNCIEAIVNILNQASSSNKKISFLIGLYHLHGRKPFLSHFYNLKNRGLTEDQLRFEFAKLRGVTLDSVQDESWFQDQVNHPRESQHTLSELIPIFADYGFHLDSTSIDKFQGSKVKDLLKIELELDKLGEERLKQQKYFSGFFTCLFKTY